MKFIIFLISLLIAGESLAARVWSSISVEDQVYLVRDLHIANSQIMLQKSSKLRVLEITSLDMINVFLYKVKAEHCTLPKESADLELYTIKQNRGQTTIGIELLRECNLELYVEKKDHKTLSLFN